MFTLSLGDHNFDVEHNHVKSKCNFWFCLRDAASRRAVLSAIDVLAQSQPDAVAAHLPSGLLTCGVVSKGIMPGYDFIKFLCLPCYNSFMLGENHYIKHLHCNNYMINYLLVFVFVNLCVSCVQFILHTLSCINFTCCQQFPLVSTISTEIKLAAMLCLMSLTFFFF